MPAKGWNGRPEEELRKIGLYYGYPKCCVDYFCENCGTPGWNSYERPSGFDGTGFIPCPDCAKLPYKELKKIISGNRVQKTDFPNCDYSQCKKDLRIRDHA